MIERETSEGDGRGGAMTLGKRILDLALSLIALVALVPLFALVALCIKLDSRGPVFFGHERVGLNFKPFQIFKFRTMVDGAEHRGAPITHEGDSRITRVGRLLRRTKLDELPQLVNVVAGQMSLVGPRPEVPRYVELFHRDFEEILTIRPGVTGADSFKYRDEEALLASADDPEREYVEQILPEKIRLAKDYVVSSSLTLDIVVILKTLVEAVGVRMATLTGGVLRFRRIIVVAIHLALIVAANYLAFWLRFDGAIPLYEWQTLLQFLPWLFVIRGVVFIPLRLYQGLWVYTSLWDLRRIVAGVGASSVLFYAVVHWGYDELRYPRTVFLIDAILLVVLMSAVRLCGRIYHETRASIPSRRVLVFGAGDAGELIVRDMSRGDQYEAIGFIDDDPAKVGQRIHGLAVLGTRGDLPEIMANHRPHEVLIAIPHARPAMIRDLVKAFECYKVPITTLPSLRDLVGKRMAFSDVRRVSVEDLLSREPIGLDPTPVRRLITGKRVFVTGAAGSIGSELCKQICRAEPADLVLFERSETDLYTIHNTLSELGYERFVRPVVGDVTDEERVDEVLGRSRPHIIFHAAAYKHVPLMEHNACEAVKNNVGGTRKLVEVAGRYQVDRFILVSTDKAVNPTSVMGATKRVAELIVQSASVGQTRFAAVRFGNVLTSSGSVVPRFIEQIRSGGPVTVTHPDVRRYFMLIPEAVELLLHAGAMSEPASVYVLDMGEQLSVLELARNVIRLSGFVPDLEIPITFTGLRPGDKLVEDLVGAGEVATASAVEKILIVRNEAGYDSKRLADQTAALEWLAVSGDAAGVVRQLQVLEPSFTPSANWGVGLKQEITDRPDGVPERGLA